MDRVALLDDRGHPSAREELAEAEQAATSKKPWLEVDADLIEEKREIASMILHKSRSELICTSSLWMI